MPSNSLTLTVRVGCEEYLRCRFCLLLDLLNDIALAADIDIVRLEIVFNINSEAGFGKITHVTYRCYYLIVGAKIALDCICL